jgi:hypothetical protein
MGSARPHDQYRPQNVSSRTSTSPGIRHPTIHGKTDTSGELELTISEVTVRREPNAGAGSFDIGFIVTDLEQPRRTWWDEAGPPFDAAVQPDGWPPRP